MTNYEVTVTARVEASSLEEAIEKMGFEVKDLKSLNLLALHIEPVEE